MTVVHFLMSIVKSRFPFEAALVYFCSLALLYIFFGDHRCLRFFLTRVAAPDWPCWFDDTRIAGRIGKRRPRGDRFYAPGFWVCLTVLYGFIQCEWVQRHFDSAGETL
jgi:hypothetical protein